MFDALVIAGPTASGKTALAVAVAQRIGGEVISMDSRQVYRGMDIGTAKPPLHERAGVPHHGFDLVDPEQRYSAGRFARDTAEWVPQIRRRGRVPVFAGGTGFYLRALLTPLFAEPPLDAARRARLDAWLRGQPLDRLRTWLAWLDPVSAARAHDGQRTTRALEVALLTGRPLSWWHEREGGRRSELEPLIVVLDVPRETLYRRINERVERMVATGLVDEVRSLLHRGYHERHPGMNATGYRELIPHVRGDRTLDEAVTLIRNATRRYARRQTTWLRHQLPAGTHALDATLPLTAQLDLVVAAWEEGNRADRH